MDFEAFEDVWVYFKNGICIGKSPQACLYDTKIQMQLPSNHIYFAGKVHVIGKTEQQIKDEVQIYKDLITDRNSF
jgi:hypothetical protein